MILKWLNILIQTFSNVRSKKIHFRLCIYVSWKSYLVEEWEAVCHCCIHYDKYSKSAKHLELKYVIVKEENQKHRVSIEHIGTDMMIADPLTKGLPPKTFSGHVVEMGIIEKSLLA